MVWRVVGGIPGRPGDGLVDPLHVENAGHPYDGEELHELRRVQRHRLRQLPGRLVEDGRFVRPPLPAELVDRQGDDRPLLELTLQRFIEADAKPVQGVANDGGEAEAAFTLYDFLRGRDGGSTCPQGQRDRVADHHATVRPLAPTRQSG